MAIGTTDGSYFNDEGHFAAFQWDPSSYAPSTDTGSGAGASTEPAGALKQQGGTKVASDTQASPGASNEAVDYDYDSWQKANPGIEMAPGQHYPDTYKLPNHMTFSDESMYHGVNGTQGGHWGQDEQGNDTFTPGRTNMEQHSRAELADYFARVEPNAKLLPPDINDVPHHDWIEHAIGGAFTGLKNALTLPGEVAKGNVDLNSKEGVEMVADAAKNLVMGPQGSLMKSGEGTLGSFAGVRAKTTDFKALDKAIELEKGGMHPNDIYGQTGFFRGSENLWRHEIDDSKSRFWQDWNVFSPRIEEQAFNHKDPYAQIPFEPHLGKIGTTLDKVLDHPELYKAYPQLKDVRVISDLKSTGAYYDKDTNAIVVSPGVNTKSTILHEVQHAIQEIENFGRGGAPQVQGLDPKSPEYGKAYDFYQRLAGEVESRNVETRMLLNKTERQRISPLDTMDEPYDKQFVLDQAYGTTPDFDKYYKPPPRK